MGGSSTLATIPASLARHRSMSSPGVPLLRPGYRRSGRWDAAEAPGTTPGGWRQRLGSFVHLPLADFIACFRGLTLDAAEELADGFEYPKTIALAFTKP